MCVSLCVRMTADMGDWRKKAHEMEWTAADGSPVHNGEFSFFFLWCV